MNPLFAHAGYLKKILFAASLTFPAVSTQLLPARSRALWAIVPVPLRLSPASGSTTSATASQLELQDVYISPEVDGMAEFTMFQYKEALLQTD